MDELEHKVDIGFIEMRGKFDQAAAGQQQIVDLLNTCIQARCRASSRADRRRELPQPPRGDTSLGR